MEAVGECRQTPHGKRKPDRVTQPKPEHEWKHALMTTAKNTGDQRTNVRSRRTSRHNQNTGKSHKRCHIHFHTPENEMCQKTDFAAIALIPRR